MAEQSKLLLNKAKIAINGSPDDKTLPACHRSLQPMLVPKGNPLDPNQVEMVPMVGRFPCMGSACSAFDATAPEWRCHEVEAMKAQPRIVAILETIDGLLRIGSANSGS